VTEPILPDDMANSLIDGTVEASSVPTDLRGVAELFAVAHQPAADGELAGMAAAMEMFSAAITGAGAAPAATATSSNVISMFGTRITKRAAIIVGSTLLIAGTAAAAAGGAIPTPFFSSAKDTSTSVTSASVVVTESSVATTESTVESTEVQTTLESELVAEDSALCLATTSSVSSTPTSSSNSASNSTSNSTDTSGSVDDKLSSDAGKHGKSVTDFCTEVEHEAAASGVTVSSVDDHGTGTDTGSSVEPGSGKTGTGTGKGGSKDTTSTVAGTPTPGSVGGPTTTELSGSKKK
jgi:hypothetical protein